jgi:hypothetical protein
MEKESDIGIPFRAVPLSRQWAGVGAGGLEPQLSRGSPGSLGSLLTPGIRGKAKAEIGSAKIRYSLENRKRQGGTSRFS